MLCEGKLQLQTAFLAGGEGRNPHPSINTPRRRHTPRASLPARRPASPSGTPPRRWTRALSVYRSVARTRLPGAARSGGGKIVTNDKLEVLLKGRPPPHFFLHVYHHAVVLLMAWNWLEYVQTLQHIALLFNTSVHVVMYYYYFRAALKLETPWKAWVTRLQILQFSVSFLLLCVTLSGRYGELGTCSGVGAMFGNVAFNAVLLLLFVGVLRAPRKSKVK